MYIFIYIHTQKMTCHLSLPSIWRSISCLTSMINSARQAQVRNKFQHPSRRANYILMTDRVLQNPDYTPIRGSSKRNCGNFDPTKWNLHDPHPLPPCLVAEIASRPGVVIPMVQIHRYPQHRGFLTLSSIYSWLSVLNRAVG